MKNPRIALIHATPVAIDPICNTFKRLWPQAQVTNLLEDSLSAARNAKLEIAVKAVPAALKALQAGDDKGHDTQIAAAAAELGDCDALLLCQFSMASAAERIPSRRGRSVRGDHAIRSVPSA